MKKNQDILDNHSMLVDYFLHIGVDFDNEKALLEKRPLKSSPIPITEIEIIRTEPPSNGFVVCGNIKNLESTKYNPFQRSSLNISVKKEVSLFPIIGIGLVKITDEIPPNHNAILLTPFGQDACFYGAYDREPYYLTFIRGNRFTKMAIVDITYMKICKAENIPHTYTAIPVTLRENVFDPEILIIYRKAKIRQPLHTYCGNILSRYPLEDIKKYKIPNNVSYFCLPHGVIVDFIAGSNLPAPGFISFSLTSSTGEKIYGISMVYYENLPESILKEKILIELSQHEDLNSQTIFYSKSLCLLSRYPLFNSFQKYLQTLYDLSLEQTKQISFESLIVHFINSVPSLTSARSQINYKIYESTLVFQLHTLHRLMPKNGGSFILLFEYLSIECILEVFLGLLTERKIMIHAYHPSIIMIIVEALSNLIFPFAWKCPYIPLCPLEMCDIIQAPLPYICGISTQYFDINAPPDDVICVDLNNRRIRGLNTSKSHIGIELPSKYKETLTKSLNDIKARMIDNNIISDNTTPLSISIIQNTENDDKNKDKYNISIQEAFIIFIAEIMKNYRECLVPFSSENSDNTFVCKVFDKNRFLSFKPSKDNKFYNVLLSTQLFSGFIEMCTFYFNQEDVLNKISFFDNCLNSVIKYEPLLEFSETLTETNTIINIEYKSVDLNLEPVKRSVGFPILNPEIIRHLEEIYDFSKHCLPSKLEKESYLCRTDIERQQSSKIFENQTPNPTKWAQNILTQIYACWFMTLPSYIQILNKTQYSQVSFSCIIKMALKISKIMVGKGCNFKNEIFIRILIQLCKVYKMPKLALKIIVYFQDMGVPIDSVSYGIYHIMLTSVPTEKKNKIFRKWKKVVLAITFTLYLKKLINTKNTFKPFYNLYSESDTGLSSFKRLNVSASIDLKSNDSATLDKNESNKFSYFKTYDSRDMAEDILLFLASSTSQLISFIDNDISIRSYQNNDEEKSDSYIEIIMTTCTLCIYCNKYLYDEQLLSYYSNEESSFYSKCQYCKSQIKPILNILINEYYMVGEKHSDAILINSNNIHLNEYPNKSDSKEINKISVEYMNPILLRKELENYIKESNSEYLSQEDFDGKNSSLFWNLIWYFKRLSLPSHLFYMIHYLLKTDKSSKILIICSWEFPNISFSISRPLSSLYCCPLSGESFEKAVNFVKQFVNPSLTSVRQGNLMAFVSALLDIRSAYNNDSWSMYWETLFIILICSQRKVNFERFDAQYQTQLRLLEYSKFVMLKENDKLPSERSLAIRKLLGPLSLIKPSAWVETYLF